MAHRFITSTSASCTARLEAEHGSPGAASVEGWMSRSAHACDTVKSEASALARTMRSAFRNCSSDSSVHMRCAADWWCSAAYCAESRREARWPWWLPCSQKGIQMER